MVDGERSCSLRFEVKNTFIHCSTYSNVWSRRSTSCPPEIQYGSDQDVHKVTLRQAYNSTVGIYVIHIDNQLRIIGLEQQGFIVSWNRQCQTPDRLILPGDSILMVNGVTDVQEMFRNCLTICF